MFTWLLIVARVLNGWHLMMAPYKGMPMGDLRLSERLPRALRADDAASARDDLFCLVKAEMSSTGLSQDPLLVWPAALQSQSKRFLEVCNRTDLVLEPSLDDDRKDEIRQIANAIRHDYPHMLRCVHWYESLLKREQASLDPYTQLTFLRNVADDGPSIHDFQLGARAPAMRPHDLQVVFHRQSFRE